VADPGFERGRTCRCGHVHFYVNSCSQSYKCNCKGFVDTRSKKQVEASAAAAGIPPYPLAESLVQRCASCKAEIVWSIHNGKHVPPPQRALIPVKRQGNRFVVAFREVYTSHLVTCGNADNHKGRAGHESGPG
jgi:hypothetical protein